MFSSQSFILPFALYPLSPTSRVSTPNARVCYLLLLILANKLHKCIRRPRWFPRGSRLFNFNHQPTAFAFPHLCNRLPFLWTLRHWNNLWLGSFTSNLENIKKSLTLFTRKLPHQFSLPKLEPSHLCYCPDTQKASAFTLIVFKSKFWLPGGKKIILKCYCHLFPCPRTYRVSPLSIISTSSSDLSLPIPIYFPPAPTILWR